MMCACVQMCSSGEVTENISVASNLIRDAAAKGAVYIQTPETTNIMETRRDRLFREIRYEADCPALAAFSELARDLSVWLHVGSLVIRVGEKKAANRGYILSPEGKIAARYDKIHMFDVDLPGEPPYRESHTYVPGNKHVVCACAEAQVGLSICYDLRFAALYRALAMNGAGILSVPTAFTRQTGEAHWEVLVRARAIENGAFVIAAAQSGHHACGRETYGGSLIVDPWGEVLARAAVGTAPEVLVAPIDLARVREVRRRIPSLSVNMPIAT